MRTLIIDDEPLAIERLQILCAQIASIDLVGTANDGDAALRMVEALRPELLLLDIAMPGLDGLGVARALEKLGVRPAIIFCTAYDNFAIEAFDVAAAGYLLKPVALEKLERAVERVKDRIAQPAEEAVGGQVGRRRAAAQEVRLTSGGLLPHVSQLLCMVTWFTRYARGACRASITRTVECA